MSLNRISDKSKELTEVVVVDDGSTDRSMEIIESKKDEILPLKIVTIRQENQGAGPARNLGLEKSSGKWILFLDADDELAFDPIPYIQKYSNYSALGFSVMVYKYSKPYWIHRPVLITLKNHLNIFTARNAFQPSNIIFKKDRMQSPFDPDYLYIEDWLFWIMNPLIFEKMKIFRKETSVTIHVHGGNKSANFAMNGKYRKRVAYRVLADIGDKLAQREKNNLLIQSQIGLIQQGKKMEINTFLRFPCDMKLYAKLIIYYLFWKNFSKYDIYGR